MSLLDLKGVSLSFAGSKVLDAVDFSVPAGRLPPAGVASSQVVRPRLAATLRQASTSFVAMPRRRKSAVTSTMLIQALPAE